MADRPVELDRHRGAVAQRSTEFRRRLRAVQTEQAALRQYREEFEALLLGALAKVRPEAAAKAQTLMHLFAATPYAQDRRRQQLIEEALGDFQRLCTGAKEH
jgi:hypothetical protein